MALITQIKINSVSSLLSVGLLKAEATTLPITVSGDSDAFFSAQVTRSSDNRFYNFKTKTFEATTTSQSRLKNQNPRTFNVEIPAAASGDTYTVIIMAEPHYNTSMSMGNGIRYSQVVRQKGNATITFIASGDGFTNTAIGNRTGSSIDTYSGANRPTIVMDKKQITVPSAASDFGFFITDTTTSLNKGIWSASALYWQSGNYTADGGGTDSTSLTLTSVDGLVVGMQVSSINSVFQSDLRAITAINTSTKTVTLDGNETWSDTHVILFRAYGPRLINDAISIGLELTDSTVELGQTTTTIDDEITSNISAGADINVNGTLGISKGATIRMRGLNKSSSSSACTVSAVDNSANGGGVNGGALQLANGQIEASSDRPVRTQTKIYIDGSSNKVFLNGTLSISKYPEANQNIYIDTNKILTQGTAT